MRHLTIALLAALPAVGACHDRVTAPGTLGASEESGPQREGVILGQVVGRTFSQSPDSGFTFTDEPIAQARVDAYLFRIDSVPPDSGAPGDSLPPPILIASATTNAQGRFQLTTLEAGFYTLTAIPPAGSRFNPGSVSLSVDARGTTSTLIVLFASPDSVPPDTTPPPPPPPDTIPDDSGPPPPPPPDSLSVSARDALGKLFGR